MDCECLGGCPFFHDRMSNMPAMAEIMKQNYCQSDWDRCARHKVLIRIGKANVPSDLFPNQQERLAGILA